MARHKCRDCSFCTESGCMSLLLAPFRFFISPFRMISWMAQSKCPECGHPLKYHRRDERGRFAD